MKLGSDEVRSVHLGENCGFLLAITGLLCFGMRSSMLGIGAAPKQSPAGDTGCKNASSSSVARRDL